MAQDSSIRTELDPVQLPNLMVEVAVGELVAGQILDQALQLPAGVYEDNFITRARVIEAADGLAGVFGGSEIGSELAALRKGDVVAVTVNGLPTDPDLPPAPLDGSSPHDKKTFVSEGILLGIGLNLGMPSLLVGEKKEALIHQVTPVQGREDTQSNRFSQTRFSPGLGTYS